MRAPLTCAWQQLHDVLCPIAAIASQVKEKVKSMLAAKSFEPVHDLAQMERWISLMAEELAARMATDYEENLRRPRNLIVHYRCACCFVQWQPSALVLQSTAGISHSADAHMA